MRDRSLRHRSRRQPHRPPDLWLAVNDIDYYAEIHKQLHGEERARFETAVDDLWRAAQEQRAQSA